MRPTPVACGPLVEPSSGAARPDSTCAPVTDRLPAARLHRLIDWAEGFATCRHRYPGGRLPPRLLMHRGVMRCSSHLERHRTHRPRSWSGQVTGAHRTAPGHRCRATRPQQPASGMGAAHVPRGTPSVTPSVRRADAWRAAPRGADSGRRTGCAAPEPAGWVGRSGPRWAPTRGGPYPHRAIVRPWHQAAR